MVRESTSQSLSGAKTLCVWFGLVAACTAGTEADSPWGTAESLPEPLQEIHAAVWRGQIYVAGGYNAADEATTSAYRYNLTRNQWEDIADLPEPRHHMPLVALNDTLYAVGGLAPTGAVQTLWAYDGDTDRWLVRTPLPQPRGASAAGAVNGDLVVVGGFDETRTLVGPVAIYDPERSVWRTGASIPTPRDHLGAAVVDGLLFCVGGRPLDADRNLDIVEAYDITADRWTTKTAMPSERGGLTAVTLGDRIHTFGGETRSRVFDNHEVYDPVTDAWSVLPSLPTARHGLGAATVRGMIFTIGGGPEAGFAQTSVVEVFTP